MDILQHPLSKNIFRLSHKIRRRIESSAHKDMFSGAQGRTLHYILAQSEDLFQKDVEEELGIRSSTATELLKKMEISGLIYREATEQDGRLKRIIATPKALQYKELVMSDLFTMEKELVKGISEEELDIFYRVIKKMENNMK